MALWFLSATDKSLVAEFSCFLWKEKEIKQIHIKQNTNESPITKKKKPIVYKSTQMDPEVKFTLQKSSLSLFFVYVSLLF